MLSLSDVDIKEVIKIFNSIPLEVCYIVPTPTGMNKSIMDAHHSVRDYLKERDFHDYSSQNKGPEGKIVRKAFFVEADSFIETKVSLYRPKTKNGDPRIWFSKLNHYANASNLLALLEINSCLYVINASDKEIVQSIKNNSSPLLKFISRPSSSDIAEELLDRLKEIAKKGWLLSTTIGDTGVGSTIEYYLGIEKNSSKSPDYKGIELKATRSKNFSLNTRGTRKNLFAQVPNWHLSRYKSSGEILERFGYMDGSDKRLYCTIKANTPNRQGLYFETDYQNDYLIEKFSGQNVSEQVATWEYKTLRQVLKKKHKETFWIGALNKFDGDSEYFKYYRVIHTRSPIVSNFSNLVELGVITMDHLIKKTPSSYAKEKGPLFKILIKDLPLLFPDQTIYELNP
jgi:hypothetical protein